MLVHGREWVLDRHGGDKQRSVATHRPTHNVCSVKLPRSDLSVMARQMTCRCCFAAPKLGRSVSTLLYPVDMKTAMTVVHCGESRCLSLIVEGTGGLDRFAIRESSAAGANNSAGPFLDCFP
jgi:hypothetical protein